jgi:hypothetical protein
LPVDAQREIMAPVNFEKSNVQNCLSTRSHSSRPGSRNRSGAIR